MPVNRKAPIWMAAALFFVLLWGGFSVLIHNALNGTTPGIDFYVFWAAGRVFFDHHNPYAPEVDRQIQAAIFEGPPPPGKDPMEFEYPAYVLPPLTPFTWLSFDWAQAVWLALNLLLILTVAYVLFPGGTRVVRLLFPFFYPVTFGLILGNFTILIVVFLLVFLKYLLEDRPMPAALQVVMGLSLGWASAKPQFVWLILLLILLYSLRRRMWPFLGAFAGGLAALLIVSFWFLPNWPILWWEQLSSYQAYSTILLNRYLAYLLPVQAVAPAALVVTLAGLGITLWLFWQWWRGQVDHLLVIGWCGAATFLVDVSTVAYEQLIFLIPLYLWAARQKPSLALRVLWTAAWLLSYILFYLDFQKILPGASDELPFLFYAAWLGGYAFPLLRRMVALKISLTRT